MEGYIGEMRMFAGTFEPLGWAFCNGQMLSIVQNTALFSLIGTTYGGDGQTTYALPDLRSRVAIGPGQGPGLSAYDVGATGGAESNTLSANNIGNHSHGLTGGVGILVSSQDGHTPIAINNFPAINGDNIYSSATNNIAMAGASVALSAGPAGTNPQPVNNMKPYLGMNYIICIEGIFPTRF